MNLICLLKGCKRDKEETTCFDNGSQIIWNIKCSRCNKKVNYDSPRCRLISQEQLLGFDGK